MPFIPALERQRQAELCEIEASLVYKASSRITRAVAQRNPVFKQTKIYLPYVFVYVCAQVYIIYTCTMYTWIPEEVRRGC